jgi:transcriptional regulator with XRE-family HTH domain
MVKEKFRLALVELKKRKGLSLAVIAKASGRSTRQIQGVLSSKEKKGLGLAAATKLAEYLGTTYEEMLELGGRVLAGSESEQVKVPPPAEQPHPLPVTIHQLAPVDDVVDMLRNAESHMRELDLRLNIGRAVFEMMPVAAVLIRDGIVVVQNLKSRLLGKALGFPLCDSCIDAKCHGHRLDCALQVAMLTHTEATEERVVVGVRYRVAATPIFIGGREYILLTAIDLSPSEVEV